MDAEFITATAGYDNSQPSGYLLDVLDRRALNLLESIANIQKYLVSLINIEY
ncbi:hypothetical protein ACZ87_02917 [Candidatus Erwinia dacicola]|uniref:Uncharacterized protein n=1 Tax=Candidatus Erwinia dacicola TaxID=252393 RepID=A0A328TIH9_9GAMM|nr:hypothetical protein ACZ87_02917 [Candidatus Erwinia dacicola]